MMPTQITSAGSAVDSIEIARPWITLVPWPVTEDLAIDLHGPEIGAGIVFGDHDQRAGDGEADHAAPEQRHAAYSPRRREVSAVSMPIR